MVDHLPFLRLARTWIDDHPVRAATLGNWFQQGCSLLATIVTVPFILRHFTAYESGLWLAFQSWLAVVGLTNFGFTFAIWRQTAFVLGARDANAFRGQTDFIPTSVGWAGVSELYAASRVLFRWGLLAATFLLIVVYGLMPVKAHATGMGTLLLWTVMGGSLLLNLKVQRFNAFLDGLGFMFYSRMLSGAYQLLWSALAMGILLLRPSLILLAAGVFVAATVQLVAARLLLFSVANGKLDAACAVPIGLVKRLFKVSAPVGLVTSSAFAVSTIQVPFISLLLGFENVAPYFLVQRIGQVLFSILNQVSQSQMPRFTQELGAHDFKKAHHRMRRILALATLGAVTVGLFYWAFTPLLVRLWVGQKFFIGHHVLTLMAVDYVLLAISVPWAWFVLASGRNPFVFSTISNGVLNVVLIGALVPHLGLIGLPLAGIASGLASNVLYNIFKGGQLLRKLDGDMRSAHVTTVSDKYVLLTAAAPLREGGSGVEVLAWNWLVSMQDRVALVLAPSPLDAALAEKAQADSPVPLRFIPSFGLKNKRGLLNRLASVLDLILFALALPRLVQEINHSGARRIFAFAGARAWFLARVRMLRWFVHYPIELYLVDDFEAWQRLHHHQQWQVPLIRRLEKGTLSRMDRVWAISPGYVDHLQEKYGGPVSWLPLTVRKAKVTYMPYRAADPDLRIFVFMGAINALYADALLSFAKTLSVLNANNALGYQSRLDIYTYGMPDDFAAVWSNTPEIKLQCKQPDGVRHAALQSCWAVLLAFAFKDESQLMITTSFSTKFTESVTSGRPVVFYGPENAAVIRHASERQFPLIASSTDALTRVLQQIPREDSPALISRYESTLQEFHSPEALRRYLTPS